MALVFIHDEEIWYMDNRKAITAVVTNWCTLVHIQNKIYFFSDLVDFVLLMEFGPRDPCRLLDYERDGWIMGKLSLVSVNVPSLLKPSIENYANYFFIVSIYK